MRHPDYPKPVLFATKPDQVWTWDITKLLGPYRGIWFFLYTVLDMFSRYVVGWMVAERETGDLARELVERACEQQGVNPYQLALHADRGDAMTSKTLMEKMDDLKVGGDSGLGIIIAILVIVILVIIIVQLSGHRIVVK